MGRDASGIRGRMTETPAGPGHSVTKRWSHRWGRGWQSHGAGDGGKGAQHGGGGAPAVWATLWTCLGSSAVDEIFLEMATPPSLIVVTPHLPQGGHRYQSRRSEWSARDYFNFNFPQATECTWERLTRAGRIRGAKPGGSCGRLLPQARVWVCAWDGH